MSMQAPVENGFNFVSPTFNSPMLATGTRHIQDDRVRSSNNFIFVINYFCCWMLTNTSCHNKEGKSGFSGGVEMFVSSDQRTWKVCFWGYDTPNV